ncbi:hypothetical protein H0H92_004666 [Tricholoma furcatifolium]|nr:hypothetical protein H0H92_004666 [Tricholoma furcatifolium]
MGRNIKQQLPPPIGTRTRNKDAHPAVKAGVTPKPRRSAAQMELDRAQNIEDRHIEEERQAFAKSRVAEIEDRLRQEDLDRDSAANHPPVSEKAMFQPQTRSKNVLNNKKDFSQEKLGQSPANYDDGDSLDEYQPVPDAEEESDSCGNPEDDGQRVEHIKQARKRKPTRDDITALRKTNIAAGQQKSIETEPPSKKHKPTALNKKKSAFVENWKSGNRQTSATGTSEPADQDSMVQMGGFMEENDNDEIEHVVAKASGPEARGRQHLLSMVKITSKPFVPKTQKELRGGKKKWNLDHLPDERAREGFRNTMVYLVKEKAGTLAPWAGLSTKEVQEIVNIVFGEGEYSVTSSDAWTGLVPYRLNDWRGGFISAARIVVEGFFAGNPEAFPDKNAVREAVSWYTTWHGEDLKKTAAYQWNEWKDKKTKSGFCQTPLIIETLARAHFTNIDKDPVSINPTTDTDLLPIGALILSLQAVEHALKEFETGSQVVDKTPKGFFSEQNYGDKSVKETGPDGQKHHVMKPWATRYMPSIKKFNKTQWNTILMTAQEYIDELPPRRGRKSRSMSQASSTGSVMEVEEVFFESEDGGEDSLADGSSQAASESESGIAHDESDNVNDRDGTQLHLLCMANALTRSQK